MTDVTILPAGFDLDVLERTGRYAVEAPENGPVAGRNYFVDVVSGNIGGVNHVWQTVIDATTNKRADRTKKGVWTAWNVQREALTANRTYYVRTDGDDANSGLADTAADAWGTIAGALSFIARNLTPNGYVVTIQLNAGTHVGAVLVAAAGDAGYGGFIRIIGDVEDASAVTITPVSTFAGIGLEYVDASLIIQGCTIGVATVYPVYCVGRRGAIYLGYDMFTDTYAPVILSGTPSTNTNQALFYAAEGAKIEIVSDVLTTTLNGAIRRFARAISGGAIDLYPDEYVNTVACTINTAGIVVSSHGRVNWGPGTVTLTDAAFTGKRYDATGCGLITGTTSIDSTFGATEGTTASGGQAI